MTAKPLKQPERSDGGSPEGSIAGIYRVRGWHATFENKRSRQIDRLSYVVKPNKQHGNGFVRLMAHPNGRRIFGCFCLIAEAVSLQEAPRFGWLSDSGRPPSSFSEADEASEGRALGAYAWTAADLAERFRGSQEEFREALEFLSSSRIGWLSFVNSDGGLESEGQLIDAEVALGGRHGGVGLAKEGSGEYRRVQEPFALRVRGPRPLIGLSPESKRRMSEIAEADKNRKPGLAR